MSVWSRPDSVRSLLAAALFCASATPALAGLEQPVDGVRYPTAGILAHREFRLQLRFGPDSELLTGVRAGLGDVVHAGVFFALQNVIDRGDIVANDHVGFEVRARALPETRFPALALGFSSQGWGIYDGGLDRYTRKSPGFYLVASKNWRWFGGDFAAHLGGNYSLETDDGDKDPDLFASVDWSIARRVSLLAEMDAAWNDNNDDGLYGNGDPYLDVGVRVGLGDALLLMLVFSDLTGSLAGVDHPARELEMVFAGFF